MTELVLCVSALFEAPTNLHRSAARSYSAHRTVKGITHTAPQAAYCYSNGYVCHRQSRRTAKAAVQACVDGLWSEAIQPYQWRSQVFISGRAHSDETFNTL